MDTAYVDYSAYIPLALVLIRDAVWWLAGAVAFVGVAILALVCEIYRIERKAS